MQPSSQPWRGGPAGWGNGRARGRGRFWSGASTRGGWRGLGTGATSIAATPEPPLGLLLSSLTKNEFDKDAQDHEAASSITDLKTVASFNWLDRPEPTIVLPGKPPRWTPLGSPRQLELDKGDYLRDPNSANFPKHPMQPAVIAAVTMQPEVSRQIDVVACGSTIGNLLRFLRGEGKRFRMLVELVGETVFLVRRENTPRELIPDVHGFGHTFPDAYTTWDPEVAGSTSHQRVISYRFGGLGFLVRFEGDGYIAGDDSNEDDAASEPSGPTESDVGAHLDSLPAALAGNYVTSTTPQNTKELKVIRAGQLIPQDHIFDLKTRSVRKKETETFDVTLGDQLGGLWVAQIPRFILAYHTRGVFDDINIRAVQEEVNKWESSHVDELSRLAALIHRIISLVKSRADKKLELRQDTVGMLEVREQLGDAGNALSDTVRELWESGGDKMSCERSSSAGHGRRDSAAEGSGSDGWDAEFEPDYTACSAEDCGYCGRCSC